MEEERIRIKKELKRMIDNDWDTFSITISYKIQDKYKKKFLQDVITEFNNEYENESYKYITMTYDPTRTIVFEYKEKSLYKKIKDFLYYGIYPNTLRTEYSVPIKYSNKKNKKN